MQLLHAGHARRLATEGPPKQVNQAFVVILAKITRQIAKGVSHGHMSTIYNVPPILLGHPIYTMADALAYLEKALENKGYVVTSHTCGTLAILWTGDPGKSALTEEEDRFNIDL